MVEVASMRWLKKSLTQSTKADMTRSQYSFISAMLFHIASNQAHMMGHEIQSGVYAIMALIFFIFSIAFLIENAK